MSKSLEKIRDIKSLINEFYQGELSECARKSWLVFQQYCDDIKQDLELLEQLKQQRDSLAINNGELCVKVTDLQKENQELRKSNKEIEELYLKENKHWCEDTDRLRKENEKLKKVINWLNQNLNFKIEKHKSCPNCMFVSYKDLQEWLEPSNEIVDLLKEVLE